MTFRYKKIKPNSRKKINAAAELEKLIQKQITSSLKDFLKSSDLFSKGKKSLSPLFEQDGGMAGNQKKNPADQRQMEFYIDQMVAEALMNGKHTSGILRSLFGLVPSLIGR